MSSGVYLVKDGGGMVEMTEQPYASEDLLQKLLADYPSLLAGNQINPTAPRKWLLVSRETPLASEQDGSGRWSVDHLFLDQDAIPTIVEVKRSSDTRIRREVVGQMLEYAANAVVYWPIQSLISQFETTCSTGGKEPAEVLASFLGEDEETNTFWERVRTNLQAGRVRLVFVADLIGPELQRIVEFLNGQMNPAEVLAVQIKQYVGESFKTLIPRVVGQTAQAQQTKSVGSAASKSWDEDSFFAILKERSTDADIEVARTILTWARSIGLLIIWGKGNVDASYRVKVDKNDTDHSLITLWSYGANPVPQIEVLFAYLRAKPFDSASKRSELAQRLGSIPGVSKYLPEAKVRPNIPLTLFHAVDIRHQLFAILSWAVEEIRSASLSRDETEVKRKQE